MCSCIPTNQKQALSCRATCRGTSLEPEASTLLVDSRAMADFFRGQLPTNKGASGELNADTYIDIGIGVDIGMADVKEEEARG